MASIQIALHAVVSATDAVDDIVPTDGGGRVVFAIVAIVIVGLYLLIRRTQHRTTDAYWERQRREDELQARDPDMRQPRDDA